jgi:hypothetical protein
MEFVGDEVLCAKCEDNPDDVLILTCEHNLCLSCASKNLHEQETRSKNSFSVSYPQAVQFYT